MNRNILLVAAREFRQIMAMKSFWFTLLILPVAFALGPLLADTLDEEEAEQIVVLDRSGGQVAKALETRFALENDRHQLRDISRYVRRYDLQSADPDAVWAQHDRWYSDADIAAYRAAGGMDGVLEKINRVRDSATPELEVHDPFYAIRSADEELARAEGDTLQEQVDRLLDNHDGVDAERADTILLIGADYPRDPTVRLWSSEQPDPAFVATLQEVLTGEMQLTLLQSQGISRAEAQAVQTAHPAITITTPPPGGGAREAVLIRSIVPLAMAYLLMIGLMLSGSWMLQGSVEERSNKLLESLLACIRPEELMYGKLLGSLAVGLSMIGVWTVCAIFAVFVAQGAVADMIRPALEPVSSPMNVAAILYFFLMGYIAISIIFVAIGALADSMSEAQGYLMPVMLAILLPITFLINMIIADKDLVLVEVLTWISLWTPFAVLARLGSGIELWVMIATGILLAGFVVIELIFLGRLFRASLLATGQKPGLQQLFQRLKSAPE